MYCIDTGLRHAISFRLSEDEGKLAENLVFLALMRSGRTPYYWKGVREVDFVTRSVDNTLAAINVCYTDSIPDREYESLREFAGEFGAKVNELLVLTRDYEAKEGKIRCIPLWKWLLDQESR